VEVRNSPDAQNSDALDLESCRHAVIRDCIFDAGDDGICIKSGKDAAGRRIGVPTEDVLVSGCTVYHAHGGFTIGSEMSGGVRNVFAENCRLNSPNLNEALRFKTNAVRGGTIENAYFRNLQIGEISDAILQIDFYYEEGPKGPERPVVRNIDIRDVTCRKAKYALNVRGFPNAPIRDIRLERCTFEHVASQDVVENVQGLTFAEVSVNGKSVQRG
jgi:polygalacturonase